MERFLFLVGGHALKRELPAQVAAVRGDAASPQRRRQPPLRTVRLSQGFKVDNTKRYMIGWF